MLSYITIAKMIHFFTPTFDGIGNLFFNTHMLEDDVFRIVVFYIEKNWFFQFPPVTSIE